MLTSTDQELKLLKSNTDCVYFLASPLTCSKGRNCEFRHNEAARFNPKNCWYWSAGKCANSHCSYRHPPLDVHLTATTTVERHQLPCFYFGQGYCAKGQKCAYKHGEEVQSATSPVLTKAPLAPFITNECKESNGNSSRISIGLVFKHQNGSMQADDQPNELKCGVLVGDANVSSCAKTSLSNETQDNKAADDSSRMLGTADSCVGTPRRSGSHESAAGNSSKLKQRAATDESRSISQINTMKDISLNTASLKAEQEAFSTVQRLEHKFAASPEMRHGDCTETLKSCEESSFNVIADDAKTGELTYANHLSPCDSRLKDVGKACSQKNVTHQGQGLSCAEHIEQGVEDSDSNYQSLKRSSHFREKYIGHADPLDVGNAMRRKAPKNKQLEVNVLRAKQPIYTDQDLRFHIIENRKTALQRTLNDIEDVFQRQKCCGSLRRHGLQNHRMHQPTLDMHLNQHEMVGDRVACNGIHSGQQRFARSKQNPAHYRQQREWDAAANDAPMAKYRGRESFKRLRREGYEAECFHTCNENLFQYGSYLESYKLMGDQVGFQLPAPMPWQSTLRTSISEAAHQALIATSPDFEGPKPLSALLQEKRRRSAISKCVEANAGAKLANKTTGFGKSLGKTLGNSDSHRIAKLAGFGCSKPAYEVRPATERQEVADNHEPKANVEHRNPWISAEALLEVHASCAAALLENINETGFLREPPNETTTMAAAVSAVDTELSLSSLSYTGRQDRGSPSVDDCTLDGI